MPDLTITPDSTNRARAKVSRAEKRAIAWPDVLRAVQTAETREFVVSQFRASGFTAESWSLRGARVKMASILTAAEDGLEGRHGRLLELERTQVRELRRRLELELWP